MHIWTPFLATIGLLFMPVGISPAVAQTDADRTIRIRLFDANDVTQAELRALDGTLRLTTGTDDNTLARLGPGETATLGVRSGEIYLRLGQGGLYAETLHVRPTENARWAIAPRGHTERTYAGALAVRPDEAASGALQLVNAVPLEDYVAGVVASEYSLDDQEGRKAMAVVARTYALYAGEPSGNDYDHVDHVESQVYRGAATVTPEARAAARATRGEVLTHDGQIIQAVYSASSGGYTAAHEDVWAADRVLPYLRSKRDPYDVNSPHASWHATIPRDVLLRALSDRYARDVTGFRPTNRSQDGRVQTIELLVDGGTNRHVPSNEFRLFVNETIPGVNLKSTLFEARRTGDRYVFEGHGFGHGVGLSQWGAHEMARRGYSYRDILTFYYTDVELASLDDVDPADRPPARLASSQDEAPAEEPRQTTRRIGW